MSNEFEFEKFDFLLKCVSPKAQRGLRTLPLVMTCFDVNHNYFIFGSNIGVIYCFKRRQNSGPYLKYQLISSAINSIQIISHELLCFVSDCGLYVTNWSNQRFLYGWKCVTNATITCIQSLMSINDNKLLLISGDSDGCVRYHDLIKNEQNVVYHEMGFPIIQIEFIDCQTLLISSSLRSVVLDMNLSQNVRQVGKNERKSYGKYGAVYSHKSNIIYGSRPSLHLIKAEVNGNVFETIRLNKITQSECNQQLVEFFKPLNGKMQSKLGILKLFCGDRYIISWNDSNLLLIGSDGQFCLKERVDQLIDVKISHTDSNEVFLLLESKHIIRIRNKTFVTSLEYEESSDTESRGSDHDLNNSTESANSTESLLNLFKGPFNINAISFIDEELKNAFDKLQTSVSQKLDKLSASIISTIDSNILANNKDVFVTPVYDKRFNDNTNQTMVQTNDPSEESSVAMSPLVIQSKGKRRLNDKKINATNDGTNDGTNAEDNNETAISINGVTNCELTDDKTCDQTSNPLTIDNSEIDDLNEDNRLLMILSAYKEGNNKLDDLYVNQQSIDTEFFYSSEISVTNDSKDSNESQVQQMDDIDSGQTQLVENKSIEQRDNSLDVNHLSINWEKMIDYSEVKQTTGKKLLSICASGYNSKSEMGLIWFIGNHLNDYFILYYPSLNELDLLKGAPIQITAANYELYILTNNGFIYKKEGMDATKPLGKKWTIIKTNKSKCKLTSISLNLNDSILWCCDENGETLTYQIKYQKWSLINDFSSHSIEMKKVSVSLNDSTIVWGIDKSGKVFVRIFDLSGDTTNSICGDNWILIDGILAIDIMVCCDDNVWIAVDGNRLYRRNAKISANDNIHDEWEQVKGPVLVDDSYASISASESNDIWILTANGSVWHTLHPKINNTTNEDLDWLLI